MCSRASLKYSPLILAIFFSGCAASLPAKVEGEIASLHPSPSSATWSAIKESGINEDCGLVVFLGIPQPKGKKDFFSKSDKQVTWWATFQPATFGFIRTAPPSFTARWYAPNGHLYWEDSFAGDIGLLFAKNSLPIAETPAETFPGRWRVQIYYEGRLIDEKEFLINIV